VKKTKNSEEHRHKMKPNSKSRLILKRVTQIIPWVVMLVLTALFFIYGRGMTARELLTYTPRNPYLAVLFLMVLFAVKSLIVILPIPVLYVLTGIMFDPLKAIGINILGAAVCTAVPYFIGSYSGNEAAEGLARKYPMIKQLGRFKGRNELFFSFYVRAIGFLPCDIVSLILGSMRVEFKKYMAGTIAGMLPGLIASTLIGDSINNPASPQFILSCIATVLIALASTLVYRKVLKSQSAASAAELSTAAAEAPEDALQAMTAALDDPSTSDADGCLEATCESDPLTSTAEETRTSQPVPRQFASQGCDRIIPGCHPGGDEAPDHSQRDT